MRERLRIAHFVLGRCNPDSANGVDKTVFHLARSVAAEGHDVVVYSLTDKPAIPIPGVRSVAFPPVFQVPFPPAGRFRDLVVDRSRFNIPRRLVEDLRSWEPDFLHLHFVHMPQNLRLAAHATRSGVPYCVTINGGLAPDARRRNRHVKNIYRLVFEKRYLDQAAFLHAVSENDVTGLRAYGVRNRIVVAPNGIDLKSIPLVPRSVGARYHALTPSWRIRLLFLGRLDREQKGLDVLIEGLAGVRSDDVGLLLVGPDWRANRARLESQVEELGLTDRVAFSGPAFGPQKLELLASADVFVHPSRWEAGTPFSVLEAAATGRPCLHTERADPTRFVQRHECGVLVTPDPESIARGIDFLAALGSDELDAMGRRARKAVETEFSWRETARVLVNAYRSIPR